jgi:hypothetical protein
MAPMTPDRTSHQGVVSRQGPTHPIGIRLPQRELLSTSVNRNVTVPDGRADSTPPALHPSPQVPDSLSRIAFGPLWAAGLRGSSGAATGSRRREDMPLGCGQCQPPYSSLARMRSYSLRSKARSVVVREFP